LNTNKKTLYDEKFTLNAQVFQDDFESYSPGDLIGASSSDWTTWSGGTADDVAVVDTKANSGTNSIHFVGAGSGGPADVVLPFGGKRTSGQFTMRMSMYVEPGKSELYSTWCFPG